MKNYKFKMSDNIKIPVFENFKDSAHLTKDKYEETYKFALDNNFIVAGYNEVYRTSTGGAIWDSISNLQMGEIKIMILYQKLGYVRNQLYL